MRKLFLAVVVVLAMQLCVVSFASAGLGDIINQFPVKEGFFYDIENNRGLNVLGVEVFKYKGFSANLAYIGVDGAGMTADYSLAELPIENVPILKYLEYLNIGYGAGVRTITLNEIDGNPASDNRFIHGPVLYCKIKF